MRYQIEGFEVEVIYKKIKGIYLRVDPEGWDGSSPCAEWDDSGTNCSGCS